MLTVYAPRVRVFFLDVSAKRLLKSLVRRFVTNELNRNVLMADCAFASEVNALWRDLLNVFQFWLHAPILPHPTPSRQRPEN